MSTVRTAARQANVPYPSEGDDLQGAVHDLPACPLLAHVVHVPPLFTTKDNPERSLRASVDYWPESGPEG